ncbi:pyridoxamine 5'-phosphate oxidase family protein [Agrococcus jenensis]|uniref:Pyridoxamine 5'-phosphate oxidase n=1 Tax=Agrococcus jenensis TaxID=46353 RepID=A0A3N2ATC2_9MICO|nr:pyridoxamine 5'-phosphate oxidase family protein [Agrococcus jenensis]ROR66236.1 pyridoxamine 5'-phosphate oxidase [Agrococcus jenensis]
MPPRPRPQRRRDTERRLSEDVDVWVATASPTGEAHLVPLSFDWDGDTLLLATSPSSPTGRNLEAKGRVRLGLGLVRDVSMIDGDVEALDIDDVPAARADAFAARAGFDPRASSGRMRWYRVRPTEIQAWREVDELPERQLMRGGAWLD